MPDYRLYFLSPDGRIRQAVELQCRDDDAAIRLAETHADGRAMELWSLERRVKEFAAQGNPSLRL